MLAEFEMAPLRHVPDAANLSLLAPLEPADGRTWLMHALASARRASG